MSSFLFLSSLGDPRDPTNVQFLIPFFTWGSQGSQKCPVSYSFLHLGIPGIRSQGSQKCPVSYSFLHLGIPGIPKMSSFLFLSSLGDPRDPKNVQFLIPFFTWGSQGSQKCPVSYSFLYLGIPGIPKMSSFLFLSSRGDPRDPKNVQFLIPFFTWGSQGSQKCPVSYSFLHLGIPGIPKMSSFLFLSSLGDPRDPKNVQFLIPFFTWGSQGSQKCSVSYSFLHLGIPDPKNVQFLIPFFTWGSQGSQKCPVSYSFLHLGIPGIPKMSSFFFLSSLGDPRDPKNVQCLIPFFTWGSQGSQKCPVSYSFLHLGIPGIPKMSSFLFLSSLGDPRDPKNVQFLIPFFTWGSQGSQKCPVSYSFLYLGIPGIPKMSSFLFLSSLGDPRDPKNVQFLIPFFTWGSQGSQKCPVSYSFLHLGIPGIPKMSSFLFLSSLGDPRDPKKCPVSYSFLHLGIPGIPKMSSFLFLSSLGDPRDPKNVQFLIPFFTWGSQGSQKCPVSYSFLHLGIPGIPKMSSFLFLSSLGDPRDPKNVQFLIPFFTWGSQGSQKCPVSYSFLHLGIPGIPKMSSFLFLSSLGDPRDPKNVQFLIPFFTWGSQGSQKCPVSYSFLHLGIPGIPKMSSFLFLSSLGDPRDPKNVKFLIPFFTWGSQGSQKCPVSYSGSQDPKNVQFLIPFFTWGSQGSQKCPVSYSFLHLGIPGIPKMSSFLFLSSLGDPGSQKCPVSYSFLHLGIPGIPKMSSFLFRSSLGSQGSQKCQVSYSFLYLGIPGIPKMSSFLFLSSLGDPRDPKNAQFLIPFFTWGSQGSQKCPVSYSFLHLGIPGVPKMSSFLFLSSLGDPRDPKNVQFLIPFFTWGSQGSQKCPVSYSFLHL